MIAIVDGQPYVPYVEVQRVAENQEDERGHEEQDQQRAPIAADLPELLTRNGESLQHGSAVWLFAVE